MTEKLEQQEWYRRVWGRLRARWNMHRNAPASVAAVIAIPLALIALIPSLVGFYIFEQQNDKLTKITKENLSLATENAARIDEISQLRKANANRAHDLDVRFCEAVNGITLRDRASILEGPRNSLPILRKLGYTKEQVALIVEEATRRAKIEAAKRPLVAGGKCETLPKAKLTLPKPQPKK